MIVIVRGRVSGDESYLSKKSGSQVEQLYVDAKKVMLQVECEGASAFVEGEQVVCIGELSSWQGAFRLKGATVRVATPLDTDYFGGCDIESFVAGLAVAKEGKKNV